MGRGHLQVARVEKRRAVRNETRLSERDESSGVEVIDNSSLRPYCLKFCQSCGWFCLIFLQKVDTLPQ